MFFLGTEVKIMLQNLNTGVVKTIEAEVQWVSAIEWFKSYLSDRSQMV